MSGTGEAVAARAVSRDAESDDRLEQELFEARETVRDLSAALSTALDENARLRRLLPVPAPSRRALPRPPAIRLRRA